MKQAKILVVEDNPMNMELVCDLLEMRGYQVLRAEEARTGLALARTETPDLVLMDIGLPDMDGLEATAALKKDEATQHIPVVALTAHAMTGDEEKARAVGCAGYITKPIDTHDFPTAVEGFLNMDSPATNGRIAEV